MNKHLFIWVVLLIGGGLIALAVWPGSESTEKGPPIVNKSTLDSLITTAGGGQYDKEKFTDLELSIRGAFSNGKVTTNHRAALLQSLNLSEQKALANSLNGWFSGGCRNEVLLNSLSDKARRHTAPISELSKAMGTVNAFKTSKGYTYRLQQFLNDEYSDIKADKLKHDFTNSLSGKPFRSCPTILSISQKINTELSNFKQFYNSIYLVKIKPVETDINKKDKLDFFILYPEKKTLLERYIHYYQIYQRLLNEE